MTINRLTLILLVTLLSLPALAIAGHHYGCHYGKMNNWNMTELDTDGDGRLSFEEFIAPRVERWQSGFDGIDTDRDGLISEEEWVAFLEMHGMTRDE
jgi:hypothetical protein